MHSALVTEAARQHIIDETNSLNADIEAHKAEGFEAHGVQLLTSEYRDTGNDVVSHLVVQLDTSMGVLYVPASTSPTGI